MEEHGCPPRLLWPRTDAPAQPLDPSPVPRVLGPLTGLGDVAAAFPFAGPTSNKHERVSQRHRHGHRCACSFEKRQRKQHFLLWRQELKHRKILVLVLHPSDPQGSHHGLQPLSRHRRFSNKTQIFRKVVQCPNHIIPPSSHKIILSIHFHLPLS